MECMNVQESKPFCEPVAQIDAYGEDYIRVRLHRFVDGCLEVDVSIYREYQRVEDNFVIETRVYGCNPPGEDACTAMKKIQNCLMSSNGNVHQLVKQSNGSGLNGRVYTDQLRAAADDAKTRYQSYVNSEACQVLQSCL